MWIDPIIAIDLTAKGLIIGALASAPMGPVGVLTVQRTLNKGRWYGFVTGIGAALSDILYALVTGLGMSFVMDFVERGSTMFYLKLGGSIMLFLFGLWAFRTKPAPLRPVNPQKGTLMHNGVTGFLVTFSNPLIVFLFMALFARFGFIRPEHPAELALGFTSLCCGALLWWFYLTSIVDYMRARFRIERISLMNRWLGIVVMVAAILGLVAAFVYK